MDSRGSDRDDVRVRYGRDGRNIATIIHSVRAGRADAVRAQLAAPQLEEALIARQQEHSLRVVLFEDDRRLLLCTDFTGPIDEHLDGLASFVFGELGAVMEACEGAPDAGFPDAQALADFLRAGYVAPDYFFVSSPEATVKQVQRALDWFDKNLDFQRELAKHPEVEERVREILRRRGGR